MEDLKIKTEKDLSTRFTHDKVKQFLQSSLVMEEQLTAQLSSNSALPFQRLHLKRAPEPDNEALRGILLHRFIQERARELFSEVEAWTWLQRKAEEIGLPESILLTLPVEALLRLPQHPLFSFLKQGKAEVSLFENGRILRLDSLYVDSNRIVLIEIKTSRHVPSTLALVPQNYRKQIEAYQRIVQKIFSDHSVEAFFLWTETATWMRV